MSFDIAHMWASMGLFARLIAGFLLVMGITSLAICVERLFVLARAVNRSRSFARDVSPLLETNDFETAVLVAQKTKGSHLAIVTGTALRSFLNHKGTKLSPAEFASREVSRALEEIGVQLRRGLSVLASVGSVAPFVGLLGTVVGIITAFQSIAATGSGGLSSVAAGISD